MDTPETPSQEEVQELLSQGQELLENIFNYRNEAKIIDNQVIDSTDQYVPLDDLPYGEELIRTEPLPAQVEDAINRLEKISEGNLPSEVAAEEFQIAVEAIQNAQETLDDCTEIPNKDKDDDDE